MNKMQCHLGNKVHVYWILTLDYKLFYKMCTCFITHHIVKPYVGPIIFSVTVIWSFILQKLYNKYQAVDTRYICLQMTRHYHLNHTGWQGTDTRGQLAWNMYDGWLTTCNCNFVSALYSQQLQSGNIFSLTMCVSGGLIILVLGLLSVACQMYSSCMYICLSCMITN